MHELGLLGAVVKAVEKIAQEEKLEAIEKIVLQVGELSGVIPSYIEECYPAAVYKTFMENTVLEMEIIEGVVRCMDCNNEFNAVACDLRCPECKSQSLEPLSGREFMIKEIVAC